MSGVIVVHHQVDFWIIQCLLLSQCFIILLFYLVWHTVHIDFLILGVRWPLSHLSQHLHGFHSLITFLLFQNWSLGDLTIYNKEQTDWLLHMPVSVFTGTYCLSAYTIVSLISVSCSCWQDTIEDWFVNCSILRETERRLCWSCIKWIDQTVHLSFNTKRTLR